jgi:alginate O-acetyltransferase complex protein AlgI
MLFSSLTFIYLFLPIVLLGYYASSKKGKTPVMLISGLFFYAWGEPFYIFVLLISITIDFFLAKLIEKNREKKDLTKIFLMASIVMNLGLLGLFKYSGVVVSSINELFGASVFNPKTLFPLGISFFSLQSIAYIIDVYKGKFKAESNITNYMCFATFFPKIVAGPLVSYQDMKKEMDEKKLAFSSISKGIGYFIRGLSKKVILANNMGLLWGIIKEIPTKELSPLAAWLGILAFTFQIYFEFSGYTDMAVGMGKMLGFNFPKNFNYPYLATSVSDFLARWHISLGMWFREYVYEPLGGSKKGTTKTIINALIIGALVGLWHGAGFNYIVWGLYLALIIICEKMFLSKLLVKLPIFIQMVYTFILIVFGWVIFEMPNLTEAKYFFKALFYANNTPALGNNVIYYFSSYGSILLLCLIGSTKLVNNISKSKALNSQSFWQAPLKLIVYIGLILLCTAFIVDPSINTLLPFRF